MFLLLFFSMADNLWFFWLQFSKETKLLCFVLRLYYSAHPIKCSPTLCSQPCPGILATIIYVRQVLARRNICKSTDKWQISDVHFKPIILFFLLKLFMHFVLLCTIYISCNRFFFYLLCS